MPAQNQQNPQNQVPGTTPSSPPSSPPSRPGLPGRHRFPAYHHAVLSAGGQQHHGTSLVTFTLILTAPAVLSAALLRPRGSNSRRGR
ncbi:MULTISPECIES: hypothetical protein [Streptomyces]|uniref:Uncharacterized protein n=1 Tax=Streptomyces luteosporeus TaxID=173856 RepID=A0ABP6G8B8_9ACTN